jgi:MYXO-CTERM domain-containing protein
MRAVIHGSVVVLVATLGSSVATAERPRTGYRVMEPSDVILEPQAAGAPTIFYLNKSGGQFRASNYNDARTNYSTIIDSGISTVPAWNVSASNWAVVLNCVRDQFSRFNVNIVDVDPGNVPHFEIVVAGSPEDVGMDPNVGGVSPFTNDCSVIPNSIVYTFAEVYGNDYGGICETAAQEVAHSFGLDHEHLCQDPMTYLSGCGDKSFQDVAANCGEYSNRECACGGNTQNSVQMLYARIGAADVSTDDPPTVSITSPSNGAVVDPGFGVAATADDDDGVVRVEFRVDGNTVATDTASPYGFQTSTSLADGSHTITAVAVDTAGATATASITVTVQSPAPGAPDAGPIGPDPGDPDPDAGVGNGNGGDDDDDDNGGGGNGFVNGGCSTSSGGAGGLTLLLLGAALLRRRRR